MADDATNAALINTAGQIASTAVNVAANKKQFKRQKEAMALQQQLNKEMWDYQNVYNSPQQQMERLKNAGLNPNLIYGSGAGGMGQAGPIDTAVVPTEQTYRQTENIGNPMMDYLTARQMDAQYNATVQSTEVMRSRATLTDMQTALAGLKQIQERARSKNYASLALSEERIARFAAHKSKELLYNEQRKGSLMDQLHTVRESQITGVQLDNAFKQYRNKLASLGIYASDDPKLRLLIQGAHRMGIDLGEMMATGAKDLLQYLK